MNESITWYELVDLLADAIAWRKQLYNLYEEDNDLSKIRFYQDLQEESYTSRAEFFVIKEDNPF